MLTAWDNAQETKVAAPDFRTDDEVESLRVRTRTGAIVCPTCRQPLWLRAGEILVAHFAHRTLNDCPSSRVSESILRARVLLYRYFQEQIKAGRLDGTIELEPTLEGLRPDARVDLVLHEPEGASVAIVLLESGLKPDVREYLPSWVIGKEWTFRPVFLAPRLKRQEDDPRLFLLDPTQRDFGCASPYNLARGAFTSSGRTLHFLDVESGKWTTLRGLYCCHLPNGYRAEAVRVSKFDELGWDATASDWFHSGEAGALKKAQEAAEKARSYHLRPAAEKIQPVVGATPSPKPESEKKTEPEPSYPSWEYVCVGCGLRTANWTNAEPGRGRCVCGSCFNKGVRLRS